MKIDIIRAWKDESYRASLSQEEQALLPKNPAGGWELSDAELEAIYGTSHSGNKNYNSFSVACAQSAAGSCLTFGGSCFE
jgi:mersacidin/lichenicidin family type 2 lantibiotic